MSKNCSLAETGELLKAAKKLVIVSHVSPDGDTLGSSLALMHALRMLGKEVIINVDDEISTVYSFLPGIAGLWTLSNLLPFSILTTIKQIHGLRIICIWTPMPQQQLKLYIACCWRWESNLPGTSRPVFTKGYIPIPVHSNTLTRPQGL